MPHKPSLTTVPFTQSLRFSFLKGICILLFLGSCLLSATTAYQVDRMLHDSLVSKGKTLATNIALRNGNALLISGEIRLKNVLLELITDQEVAYTTIADNQGKILTSQFESINYNWPGLKAILPTLSKNSNLPEILSAIKNKRTVRELSVPIMLGVDTMGQVTIGLSEERITAQIVRTVLLVIAFNLVVAVILGAALFIASKKIVLDPIVALSHATSRIASGNFSTKVTLQSSGELQVLVDAFNQMAEDLNTTTVSKKYVDNIINGMLDTLVVLSPEDRIVFINPAANRLLGYETHELIGKPIADIFHDGETHCKSLIQEIRAKGLVNNIETSYRTKAGDKVLMLFSGSLITEESSLASIVCVAVDITEKEKLKEEILKLDKLESVGLLAGGIAHDFNNLLQGVFGYISLAKESIDPTNEAYGMLEKVEKALGLSTKLTQQLLTFSKGGEPIKKAVSLPSIIQDAAHFSLSGSSVDCRFIMDDHLWTVEADEGQLSQVVQNMVINSAEAMKGGGTLIISARNISKDTEAIPSTLKPGRYIQISIKDSGPGIAQEHINKIFDPYYTTKKKGNGLGLATSFSIVKKHGGIIEVQSEPGVGSTFFIYLPASEKNISPAIRQKQILKTGKGNILVMDDDDMVRGLAGRMIKKLGYEAEFAQDGDEALAKYAQAMAAGQIYDAVILDLTIKGGMGGKETIAKLIELDPGVKAVVSSGYSSDPVMAHFHEHGFQAALAKPFTISQLGETLHNLRTT